MKLVSLPLVDWAKSEKICMGFNSKMKSSLLMLE